MKDPFPVERLIQGICIAAVLWAIWFLYHAMTRVLPNTAFVKTESIWEADKKNKTVLELLSEHLEKLRQPTPLISNVQIKALRNVFAPPVEEVPLPSVFCETCGGENLGNAFICKHCGSPIEPIIREDNDKDGMPDDWEIKYSFDPKDPSDAHEDADGDSVDNLNEYLRGNNPRKDKPDTNAAPGSVLPFDLVKTYQNPIHILFMGYILLKDGRYEVQVNWAGKTEFYKIGEEIRGYAILDFKKIIQAVPNPKTGVPIYEDTSFIVCQKKKFQPKTFVKGKLVTDNDVFAKVRFADSLEEREVHIDAVIEDPIQSRTYKVTDIGLQPQKIIVVDEAKKAYTLQTQKRSPVSTRSGI
jgi:hypothetical protein